MNIIKTRRKTVWTTLKNPTNNKMKALREKKILRDYYYKDLVFADESDFDDIKKFINKNYEPIMVSAHEMIGYQALILKNGGLIITDGDDIFFNDGYEPNEDVDEDDEGNEEDLDNSNCTFYTMYLDGGVVVGSIFGIPANFRVCTLVLTAKAGIIYDKINKLREELKEPNSIQVLTVNYLSQDEIDFLNN